MCGGEVYIYLGRVSIRSKLVAWQGSVSSADNGDALEFSVGCKAMVHFHIQTPQGHPTPSQPCIRPHLSLPSGKPCIACPTGPSQGRQLSSSIFCTGRQGLFCGFLKHKNNPACTKRPYESIVRLRITL